MSPRFQEPFRLGRLVAGLFAVERAVASRQDVGETARDFVALEDWVPQRQDSDIRRVSASVRHN